jgi:enamine deaminase RidA (YjgF/YER057c/UK114 family)
MGSERRRISQGSEFERAVGYSRAVVDGRWVFVAGTTGFDYSDMTISDDIIDDALRRAGAGPEDVVRVRYMLPDAADFEACWPSLRSYFGTAAPAATMTVVGLADPRMRIEIEVTALRPAIS